MVFKNFLWDWVGRFSGILLGLGLASILSKKLTPDDFGIFGIITATIGLAGIFLEFGFSSAIIQKKDITQNQLSTIFYLNFAVGVILAFLLIFIAPSISQFYNIEKLSIYIKLASLTFILNASNLVPNALIRKRMLFKQQTIRNLSVTFCGGVIAVIMAFSGWGIWSIIFQSLFIAFSSIIVNWSITRWRPNIYFNALEIKNIISYSKFLFFSTMLDNIYNKLDILLIGKLFNMSILGQYTRALSLDGVARNISSSSILSVLFPYFSNIQKNEDLIIIQWEKYFSIICFLYTLVMGCFYLSAEFIFFWLFGSDWLKGAQYFRIISLAGIVYPLSSLALSIVGARGNSKDFFKVEVVKKIVIFPCFLAAIYYGINAFLWSLIIAHYISLYLNLLILKRNISINISKALLQVFIFLLIFSIYIIFVNIILGDDYIKSTDITTVFIQNLIYVSFIIVGTFFFNRKVAVFTTTLIKSKFK